MSDDNTETPAKARAQVDQSRRLHGLFFLVYLALFAALLYLTWSRGQIPDLQATGLDFLLLCLATFRLTQLVTEEKVAQFSPRSLCHSYNH